MSFITDLYYVNKRAFLKASKLLFNNWTIILTGFIYSLITILSSLIIMVFFSNIILGFFSGIFMFLVISAITSNYLYLLDNIISHDKFSFDDFKYGFKAYLRKVYTIFFIGWIARLLYSMFISSILIRLFSRIISPGVLGFLGGIVILILLNPLPEAIYQKNYQPVDTITYAFNFVKENWILWFIPNIIFMGLLYFLTGGIISSLLQVNMSFNFDFSYGGIIVYILGQIIFSFMMIYRGVLFNILSTSTRRKRMFMRNMYK